MRFSSSPNHYNETYQQIQFDQLPINPPLPPRFGNLSHPKASQSDSEASYVKMGSVSVKQDVFDEFYGREGSKEEALYEKVGPSQWPCEYYDDLK